MKPADVNSQFGVLFHTVNFQKPWQEWMGPLVGVDI